MTRSDLPVRHLPALMVSSLAGWLHGPGSCVCRRLLFRSVLASLLTGSSSLVCFLRVLSVPATLLVLGSASA